VGWRIPLGARFWLCLGIAGKPGLGKGERERNTCFGARAYVSTDISHIGGMVREGHSCAVEGARAGTHNRKRGFSSRDSKREPTTSCL